ncbi:MAG: hypothetical protein K0Q55_2255 [Verrucomicrobia bacterium]|jgi:hypothetical protein|nr:hypothetical protein [Verrucomicrobiota bacterium]
MEMAEVRLPNGGKQVLVPPLPGPLLQLSLEERGMEVVCFGGSGPWLSWGLDEKSQGIVGCTDGRSDAPPDLLGYVSVSGV